MNYRDSGKSRSDAAAINLENGTSDGFQLLVIALVSLLMIGCGRVMTDRGNSVPTGSAGAETQNISANSSPQVTPDQNTSAFDTAKTLSLANEQHPWDGLPKPAEKPLVSNGDSKPPEIAQHTVTSCAEQQPNRCVSCCDDFFSFGSDHWDQCVNACPQLGLDTATLQSEY